MYKKGHKHSEKTKKKIAKSHIGIPPWNKGKHSSPSYLSKEDYERKLIYQDGVCAICNKEETQRSNKKSKKPDRLRVDHNHKTGKIRGLLCAKCNFAIGLFKDNFDNIMNALMYLDEYDEVDFTCVDNKKNKK